MNHHFSPDGVNFCFRPHARDEQTTGWGPFLTGLRVNRFWSDGGAVLKDHQATSPSGAVSLDEPSELLTWLRQWFEPNFWNRIDLDLAWKRWKNALEVVQ